MTSPTSADSYMSNYYQQAMYPTPFFDSGAWSSNTADPLSYLNGYSQQMGATDYMQFPGFDYSATGFWPNYQGDYSWAAPPQQADPMKLAESQPYMPTMDQAYAETYHSPTGGHQKSVTNGQGDVSPVTAVAENDEVVELEQNLQMVSVNGHVDGNQESLSETSLHEPTSGNVNNSSVIPSPSSNQPPAATSWANIAKQPAKPAPAPAKVTPRPPASKPVQEVSWDKGTPKSTATNQQGQRANNAWSAPRSRNGASAVNSDRSSIQRTSSGSTDPDPTLSKLKQSNAYNPKQFDLSAKNARFFVIKSYSEDDIHRAIKYGVWCSTEHGNKRLDAAFKERDSKGPIFLFYSVNGSGHFCGMAQMMSGVDYQTHAGVWTQDKWKGSMEIKWVYVKDVPNGQLRHIRLENNENKPVTNSRDTQEVPPEKGRQVLKIIHGYRHTTSIFDDFGHYEKKEVEEGGETSDKKKTSPKLAVSA